MTEETPNFYPSYSDDPSPVVKMTKDEVRKMTNDFQPSTLKTSVSWTDCVTGDGKFPEPEVVGFLHDGTPCSHGLWVGVKECDICMVCGYRRVR